MASLRKEIEKRAHQFEGQGDGIFMVLIRMDEIAGRSAGQPQAKAYSSQSEEEAEKVVTERSRAACPKPHSS